MTIRNGLLLATVATVSAGCANMQPGDRDSWGGTTKECGPGSKVEMTCTVKVGLDMLGRPKAEPDTLVVKFTDSKTVWPIQWVIDEPLQGKYHFRRAGVVFLNLAPEADTLSADALANPSDARKSAGEDFPGATTIEVRDQEGGVRTHRRFHYRLVIYDKAGKAYITEDPAVDHPQR